MLDLHGISQAAFDLIVSSEVTSRTFYEAHDRRPEVPGGRSGITVGIGYDCGQTTAAIVRQDWAEKIPGPMIDALCRAAGLKAGAARKMLPSIRSVVDVPWGAALDVFSNTSVPKYLRRCHALPHFDELPPDCRGVLLSLVYNRGASFDASGNRYSEMRQIKSDMAARNFTNIPGRLRGMKRLWTSSSVRGVALRREREARLFERGLSILKAAA